MYSIILSSLLVHLYWNVALLPCQVEIPVLPRSAKLSNVATGQYLNGWPLGDTARIVLDNGSESKINFSRVCCNYLHTNAIGKMYESPSSLISRNYISKTKSYNQKYCLALNNAQSVYKPQNTNQSMTLFFIIRPMYIYKKISIIFFFLQKLRKYIV